MCAAPTIMRAIRLRRNGCAPSSQMDWLLPETSMHGTSGTSAPTICEATPSAISSPASGFGASRSAGPAGPTIGLSGPDPAHASLSARQAKAAGLLTSGTSGRLGTGSSASVALASSLGNRLKAQTEGCGSILYRLTWKRMATPSGRSISLLRASVRRTYANDFTGWPTPLVNDATDSRYGTSAGKIILKLPGAAQLCGWSTPKAENAESTGFSAKRLAAGKIPDNLHSQAKLLVAGWPTPHEGDHRPGHISRAFDTARGNLMDRALLAGWATPTRHDYRTPNHVPFAERGGGPKGEQLNNMVAHQIPGASLNGCSAETNGLGLLNPEHSRFLQGIPATWASCAPTGTRLTPTSRRRSSRRIAASAPDAPALSQPQ